MLRAHLFKCDSSGSKTKKWFEEEGAGKSGRRNQLRKSLNWWCSHWGMRWHNRKAKVSSQKKKSIGRFLSVWRRDCMPYTKLVQLPCTALCETMASNLKEQLVLERWTKGIKNQVTKRHLSSWRTRRPKTTWKAPLSSLSHRGFSALSEHLHLERKGAGGRSSGRTCAHMCLISSAEKTHKQQQKQH